MRYCNNCGTANSDNAKFCRSCGLPMDREREEERDDGYLGDYEYVDYKEERSNSVVVILIAIIAVLLVLIGIVYVLNSRSKDDSKTPTSETTEETEEIEETESTGPVTYAMSMASSWPFAGQQMKSLYSATASSVLPDYEDITYGPANILDDNNRTAWSESKSGTGEGEWIGLTNTSGSTETISTIYMLNGYTKDDYTFNNNTTPTVIDVSVGKSQQSAKLVATLNMQVTMNTQYADLDEPIELPAGDTIYFTIKNSTTGRTDDTFDTTISEIHFE